jgi:hypothetical protein
VRPNICGACGQSTSIPASASREESVFGAQAGRGHIISTTDGPGDISIGDTGDISIGDLHRVSAHNGDSDKSSLARSCAQQTVVLVGLG